ncbi:MAG: hypothetical protein II951_08930 [Bacteroidales bacterium]|nr:hypothetical protein [Bacteroidales bacterium]
METIASVLFYGFLFVVVIHVIVYVHSTCKYLKRRRENEEYEKKIERKETKRRKVMLDFNMRRVFRICEYCRSEDIVVVQPESPSEEELLAANRRVRKRGMRVVDAWKYMKYCLPGLWDESNARPKHAYVLFVVKGEVIYHPISGVGEIGDSFAGLVCMLQNDFENSNYDSGEFYSVVSNEVYQAYLRQVAERKATPYDADYEFSEESLQLMKEIEERVEILRRNRVSDAILYRLVRGEKVSNKENWKPWLQMQDPERKYSGEEEAKRILSRLIVTKDKRVLLLDYKRQVDLTPLPKAVFLLFLRHEEGIRFKDLSDHRDELKAIYREVAPDVSERVMEESVSRVVDPTDNSINEKCARIREAFLKEIDDEIARFYYVVGSRGMEKKIVISRDLVVWEE